jgi:hypothetical protein
MTFSVALTQVASVFQGIEAPDSFGEQVINWTLVTTVSCLVWSHKMYSVVKVGVDEQITHTVFTDFIQGMKDSPKARWRFDIEGRTYVVVEPYSPGQRDHHMEHRCRRLDEEALP